MPLRQKHKSINLEVDLSFAKSKRHKRKLTRYDVDLKST